MARSSRLTDGMSTSSAVSASRSVTRTSRDGDARLAEDLVDVLTVAGLELADDQRARQVELAARERLLALGAHHDAVGRDHAARHLLAGLRIDDRDARVQERALAE